VSFEKIGIPWRSTARRPASFADGDFSAAFFVRGGVPAGFLAEGWAGFPGEADGFDFLAAVAGPDGEVFDAPGFAAAGRGFAPGDLAFPGAESLLDAVCLGSGCGAAFFFFFPLRGEGGGPWGFFFRPRTFRVRFLEALASGVSRPSEGVDFFSGVAPGAVLESPAAGALSVALGLAVFGSAFFGAPSAGTVRIFAAFFLTASSDFF
jgi:hypothetical protein